MRVVESKHPDRPSDAALPTKRARRNRRLRVELDVTLHSEHNFYTGLLQNLSASGIFIATHVPAHLGDQIEFWINLGDAAVPIHGVGEVRWVRQYSETSDAPPGVGVRFLELDASAHGQVAEFLRNREPLFHDEEATD